MTPSHQDIEKLLADRLEEVRKEKLHLKEKIEEWDSRFREAKRLAGAPPKESEDEIQRQISQLERQYAITSQSKAEERKFLYEIEKLKLKKKVTANYQKYSDEIELLRNQLSAARSELLEKETAIDELSSGLRKVKLAARAGCNSSELVESVFDVDSSKLPLIVGRGGMNIRSLESDYGVSVDVDHVKGSVRIVGTPVSIQKAFAAISVIMDTVTEEFAIKYETVTCLMMDKCNLLNAIQSKFNVHIDVNHSKGLCKMVGLTNPVELAKKEIGAIASCRMELKVEKIYLPSIIGKGGLHIRTIGSEHHVVININRDDDVIEVVGLRNDVNETVKIIKNIIDENREVEECVSLERYLLLGCFVASPTDNIRTIAKDFHVRIETDGSKVDKQHIIRVKGVNSKVKPAVSHITKIIESYKNNSSSLEIADEVIPAVLGKGGAGIKAMREKYPDANIDIDGTLIHIYSSSVSVRSQILDELHGIIGENFVDSLDTTEDFAIMLKTPRAAELRDLLSHQLNVRMAIEKNNRLVKLKGSKINVKKGIDLLVELQANFAVDCVEVAEDDFPIFLKATDDSDSLIRKLSQCHKVDISANKKDLTFTIRGQPSDVQATAEFIRGYLNGEEKYGSQVLRLDNIVSSSFIGKAGANIKKMEDELGVNFDLLKSRGLLRIRGEVGNVLTAKRMVTKFLLNIRVNDSFPVASPLSKEIFEEVARKANDIFGAELDMRTTEGRDVVNIRCPFQVLSEAKQYVCENFGDEGSFILPLLEKHLVILKNTADYGLGKFKGKFNVGITSNGVEIKGDYSKLLSVKRDFMRTVHNIFPGETAFIEISRACIRDIVNAELLLELERLGAAIQCDRPLGFLWLVCPHNKLHSAQVAVESQLSPWKALNGSIKIDDFMIPLILGKSGAGINSLRKEFDCIIDIDRTALTMDIKCNTAEALTVAITSLQEKVFKMRAQYWETKIRLEFIPVLIGKQGSNINKFRNETGVQIDVDPKLGIVKLSGAEDKLPEAKRRLLTFIEEEEKYRSLPRSFSVPLDAVPLLIGSKGTTIKELQEKSGAKIDFNRESKRCSLRGRNEDCERAFNLINELLELEGYKPIQRINTRDSEIVTCDSQQPDQDTSGVQAESHPTIPRSQLSKSALKRLRKKEREFSSDHQVDDCADAPESSDAIEVVSEEVISVAPHCGESTSAPVVILPPLSIIQDSDPIVQQFKPNDASDMIEQQPQLMDHHAGVSRDLVNFLLGKDPSPVLNVTSNMLLGYSTGTADTSRLPFVKNYFPTAPSIHDVVFSAPVFGKGANVPPPGLSPSADSGGKTDSRHAPSIASYKHLDQQQRIVGNH